MTKATFLSGYSSLNQAASANCMRNVSISGLGSRCGSGVGALEKRGGGVGFGGGVGVLGLGGSTGGIISGGYKGNSKHAYTANAQKNESCRFKLRQKCSYLFILLHDDGFFGYDNRPWLDFHQGLSFIDFCWRLFCLHLKKKTTLLQHMHTYYFKFLWQKSKMT